MSGDSLRRGRLDGGEGGEDGPSDWENELMDWEMERWREEGREEMSGEEEGILWIRVLSRGFEDFRGSLEAQVRNSSGEEWRAERRVFSMILGVFDSRFWREREGGCHEEEDNERDEDPAISAV